MTSRVEQFAAVVARQPNNELFRFSLAQALVAEGRAADAVVHLEFCVAAKPDWMIPRILLGRLFVQLGRPAEARSLFEQALQLAVAQHHEDPEREIRALLAELP